MSAEKLVDYVRANPATDGEFCKQCWDSALALIKTYTRTDYKKIPEDVLEQCTLQVAANLYRKRGSQRDNPVYGDIALTAPPTLPTLDPLTPVKPILRRYMRKGF